MGEEQGSQNYNHNRIFLVYGSSHFLLTVYARIHLGISFSILLIIARLVFGYVARREGYVEKAKELSPKYYCYARRVEAIVWRPIYRFRNLYNIEGALRSLKR